MSSVPVWLQIAAHVAAIVACLCGLAFGLFVLWPSIRRQNKVAVKFLDVLERAGEAGVSKLIDRL